jgi:hypothetical protein
MYIFFFDKIKNNPLTSQKNMNYVIGGITGLVAIITFINILKRAVVKQETLWIF